MLKFELAETDKHSTKILLRRKNLRFLRRTNLIKYRCQPFEMNIELTKEQSRKGDLLLKLLCDSDEEITSEEAEKIFNSKPEFDFICKILENKKLINIFLLTGGGGELLGLRYSKTKITCGFLNNGRLFKEYRKSEKLDWYKIIPIILTLVFGFLTIYFSNEKSDLKENLFEVETKYDSLKVENISLKNQVDSLSIELNHKNNTLIEKTIIQDTNN